MALYCWGNTAHGELGLGGVEDEQICTPLPLDWSPPAAEASASGSSSSTTDIPNACDIVHIACGRMHTLMLTGDGRVFSCGCNDHGQLGQQLSRKRPQLVQGLENHRIQQVSAGSAHSVALNEWGQCFTWGSNSRGQLGTGVATNDDAICPAPKLVKSLATQQVVQIASGLYHTLALTRSGDLYAWGSNSYGQLGLGRFGESVSQPTLVRALRGIPLAFVACGWNHSLVVSKSGSVFGWGKNLFGQLGINTDTNRSLPEQLKTLRHLGVRYIACGDDFSVFLTLDGAVLTCGSGTYGQLGHGTFANDTLPRAVMELMGSTCTQIACGGRHTLVYVPSRGRIYGMGLAASGQLGAKQLTSTAMPQVLQGPWLSTTAGKSAEIAVRRIFSGGDHSVMSSITPASAVDLKAADLRFWSPDTQIAHFTPALARACAAIGAEEPVDQDLIADMEIIFTAMSCMNASFQLENIGKQSCTERNSNLDVEAVQRAFEQVALIENETLKQIIWDGITGHLLPFMADDPYDYESLRIYLLLPLYHEFFNAKRYARLHIKYAESLLMLKKIPALVLDHWLSLQSDEYFERLVDVYKGVVAYIIQFVLRSPQQPNTGPIVPRYEYNLKVALQLMMRLLHLNRRARRSPVPGTRFHMPGLEELMNLQHDYMHWLLDRSKQQFYLCDYPFLFDARAKTLLLQTDQSIQMNSAMQQSGTLSYLHTGMLHPEEMYVYIQVRRSHLVEDTLREIQKFAIGDLKKPLRVIFDGEEAEDAGGVRKEFFLLLLRDLLDPKYGMFTEYEETRAIWFAEATFEDNIMYMLIGALCGLAIYNFTIIHLPFPLVLYKRLLDDVPGLDDLKDLSPTVARSLQSLLDYEGEDFEEVFGLNFELTREVFGEARRVPLKAGGETLAVTQKNKAEYVELYVKYMLETSVQRQFNGFKDGLMRVCGGKVMQLFEPHELMAVVIGNEDYDWHVLEECSMYKNGYSSGDKTIRLFWEVFHELPLSEKKKFLLFLTGSDRIPIQGMKAIVLYFQPANNEKSLPVAHTCFNLLDLPRYQTKERLKFKLTQAIQQTLGFSLV